MSRLSEFLKTTIIGGLLFLVPAILLALVLRHAMGFAGKIAKPIAALFPEQKIAGVAIATVLAVLVLVLVSLMAGLVARTRAGRRLTHWFEDSLLGNLPQYQMVKTMAEGLTKVENAEGIKPALVSLEGGWQLAYVLEELRDGWVAIFLPQAPTPMSGNVMYMPADLVRRLDMPIGTAMMLVKHMGVGSATALKNADLSLPAGH